MVRISNTSKQDEDIIKYTTCSGHCLTTCVLKVRVRDGVVVSIEPDDSVNPGLGREDEHVSEDMMDRGMFQHRPCAKGYAWREMLYDPNRLKYPMKRVGKRGEAKFERISWSEALDTIAGKLVEVKEKYGPYSIMHHPYSIFGESSFPLAPWFGAGVATWQCHSTGGVEQPLQWVFGQDIAKLALGMMKWFGGGLLSPFDELALLESRLVVLWGTNPLATSPGTAKAFLRAKERGVPIICIEPRYTSSAEVLADQWIPVRPTTDVAMMTAMANVWFKEDLWDKEFVEKWVEPEGLKQWRAYVMGADDGIDKTIQWAETICGVPAETIAEFARLYARSKPVTLLGSITLGRQFFGENHIRALMYMQSLTGNVLTLGGTNGLSQTHPSIGLRIPVVDWQRKPGPYTPPTMAAAHKWHKAIDLREKLDKGEMSPQEYNNAIGNVPGNPCPNIQIVIEEGTNHVNSLPDVNSTIRAMKKVDFVLVWAQYAESPMARYADILLPLGYSAFEGRQEIYWGRWWPGSPAANWFMHRQKCVDPPGEIKPVDWVWTQVAKRLGIADLYNPRMADVPDEGWDEAITALDREAYEKWASMEQIARLSPPTWEEFQKKPIFRMEIPKELYEAAKGDVGPRIGSPFMGTESGKIEFYSKALAKGPDYLANSETPPGSGRCYGGGNLPPTAQMTMGGRDTFYSRDTQEYPLLMSSPHAYFRVHSWLDNNRMLRDECYRHAVWMSVADAKSRGIKDDDLVRVHNDIGEMILPAYVTSRVLPGTVFIYHGAWYKPNDARNQLMPDGIDRRGSPNMLTHNDDLPDTVIGFYPCKGLVQIHKWEGG